MRRYLALALLLSACTYETAAERNAQRTAELRAEFPPGTTHRADVLERYGRAPEISLARPSEGWDEGIVRDAEERTGSEVARAEKYVAPTGTSAGFMTLEHVWYFYDRDEALVDVVFQRIGD